MRKALWTDAAFGVVLMLLAVAGLHTTYAGGWFLAAGAAGIVLGLAAAVRLLVRRQPLVAVFGASIVAYVLGGSAVIDPGHALAGVIPTPYTLHEQALVTVDGWKEMLTTLPPVATTGPLLIVPYLLGLAGTALCVTLANRLRRSAVPVAAPVAVLATVIALGTHAPGERLLDSVVFAAVALVWIAVRAHRGDHAIRSLRAAGTRFAAGGAVLGVAALVSWTAAPQLPGADPAGRVVLRDHVTAPFDLSAYPSPLVGFRKYTKDAKQLYDQTLFTVSGLPGGTPIRIATLDDYDGSVWGARNVPGDEFQRVGEAIPAAASGRSYTAHVTIERAYAAAGDVNVWLPEAGAVTGVDFAGRDAVTLAEGFRFNTATSTAVVPDRLRAGDTYSFTMVDDPVTMPADAQPYGPSPLLDNYASLVASRVAQWTKGATGAAAQLHAVATYFAGEGAYTDGGPGETQYLPGHSVGRLTSFFNEAKPAGDDEQYAAALALIANYLGLPARVVLGAIPEADGTVRGSDVHAWVEIHLADGRWATIPDSAFLPPASRHPDAQPPTDAQNANAAVVPPPNTTHPPTSYTDDGTSANQQGTIPDGPHALPAFVQGLLAAVRWAGPPVGALAAVLGAIIGLKRRRRRIRRTRGSPANRCAQGWHELIDHARDLGRTIPSGRTRRQEALVLGLPEAAALAAEADDAVYGPDDPSGAVAASYWTKIDAARAALTAGADRWHRLRAAVSVRSLRPRAAGSALEEVLA